jgi:hypothetical protein
MSDPNDPIKRIRVHPENKNSPANSRELVPLAATDYDTLLARHFADLKPGNVVEQKHVEAMVYDMAGELELRRAMMQVIHDARAAALASALSDLIDPPLVSDDELMEKIAKYEAELARGEAGLRLSGRTQVNTGAIQCALEQCKKQA